MTIYTSNFHLDVPSIDIQHLIEKYPRLRSNCKTTNAYGKRKGDAPFQYDFTKASNQYDITETIVQEYFNVPQYSLHRNKLCPRINNRMEYLSIVENCLMEGIEIYSQFKENKEPNDRWIVDIGTGSSLIYPILGLKLNERNKFIATEINRTSIAHINSLLNDELKKRIKLVVIEDNVSNLIPIPKEDVHVSYVVCNPPFYKDENELKSSETKKFTKKPNEMVSEHSELYYEDGGEVGFVKRIIDESIIASQLPQFQFCWFTSQLGIYDHISILKEYLTSKSVIQIHEFRIQFKTSRWILAWSFQDIIHPVRFTSSKKTTSSTISQIEIALNQHFEQIENPHFRYKLIGFAGTNNKLYVIVNEVIWLRRVRRMLADNKAMIGTSSERTSTSPMFNKSIILRLYQDSYSSAKYNVEVVSSVNFPDIVTISNSFRSFINTILHQ
ncbi:uncharacterized protein RJT20DRAFT_30007 [Scheffersomyces xylosifermentans]|uniref:uncharacterized protein n=1 Tax=Scheffersomyces xylosifermentans TaxID=1304137 RepID=UPI00315E01C4